MSLDDPLIQTAKKLHTDKAMAIAAIHQTLKISPPNVVPVAAEEVGGRQGLSQNWRELAAVSSIAGECWPQAHELWVIRFSATPVASAKAPTRSRDSRPAEVSACA